MTALSDDGGRLVARPHRLWEGNAKAPPPTEVSGGARCVAGLDGSGGDVGEPALAAPVIVVADALHVDGAPVEDNGDVPPAAGHGSRISRASATSTSAATAAAMMHRSTRASVIGAAPVPESCGRRLGQRS